MTILD
jgi:CopG family transcriptional regulator, nickel-responsive regulator